MTPIIHFTAYNGPNLTSSYAGSFEVTPYGILIGNDLYPWSVIVKVSGWSQLSVTAPPVVDVTKEKQSENAGRHRGQQFRR